MTVVSETCVDAVKNPAAVALGKLGGSKGGRIRADKLSTERKKAFAQQAAQARWAKDRIAKEVEASASHREGSSGRGELDDKSKHNGGDGRHHQLIDGLRKTLPPERSEWSTEDRRKWLQAAAAIFDLIYQNSGRNQALRITAKRSMSQTKGRYTKSVGRSY